MLKQRSYTVKELADAFRVDVSTVRRWIASKRIRGRKLVHDYVINYSIIWNAECLPNGFYFCTLKAHGFTATRKMVLVK